VGRAHSLPLLLFGWHPYDRNDRPPRLDSRLLWLSLLRAPPRSNRIMGHSAPESQGSHGLSRPAQKAPSAPCSPQRALLLPASALHEERNPRIFARILSEPSAPALHCLCNGLLDLMDRLALPAAAGTNTRHVPHHRRVICLILLIALTALTALTALLCLLCIIFLPSVGALHAGRGVPRRLTGLGTRRHVHP
jgi:hypothetical protein